MRIALLCIGLTVLAAGCYQHHPAGDGKEYDIKGKVMSVDQAKNRIKLDHEDIPGLMKAMKMDFDVEDPKLLGGLSEGDTVQGKLRTQSGKYVLTKLEKR